MTKLVIWACALALTPVLAGLAIRMVAWSRQKSGPEDIVLP